MSDIAALAEQIIRQATQAKIMLATAESCTGGMVAAALSEIDGASVVLDRGFVTYSNPAKTEMLGVPAHLIATYGAVSDQTAQAMAEGAIKHSHADLAIAITGIAGPGGGSAEKPVGLVHFGLSHQGQTHLFKQIFKGDRQQVRHQATLFALTLLLNGIKAR